MTLSSSQTEQLPWETLAQAMQGEIAVDQVSRILFSTDASVYQQLPRAVAFPGNEEDLIHLIRFARQYQLGLIPRTAGTSLAGQVVGDGLVVDFSRHLNRVLHVDPVAKTVRVQPGVIRDELNLFLADYGLLFGPETSTSNRAMLGGMLGNNSAGANSIVYGSTRDQVVSVRGYLSCGTPIEVGPESEDSYVARLEDGAHPRQQQIYQSTLDWLSLTSNQQNIDQHFPDSRVSRRNTGYALDSLLNTNLFGRGQQPFNFARLIAGSEGTLMMVAEMTLQCHELPPKCAALVCPHYHTVSDALRATEVVLKHSPWRCELIDDLVLEGAARNLEQRKNSFFIEGQPGGVLLIELRAEELELLGWAAEKLRGELEQQTEQQGIARSKTHFAYACPVLLDDAQQSAAWALRKAGLGMVANVVGDTKPVTVIEDTAVATAILPEYIDEIDNLLDRKYGVRCVHYAHAGAGEIHLRPMLNLKSAEDRRRFREMAGDVAALVKKFGGSLSGEHGDGRLRAEFIEQMVGSENFQLMKMVKQLWDPDNLLNPGKIVNAPPMDQQLRTNLVQPTGKFNPHQLETVFDFGATEGYFRATEMCSGSGDCRKSHLSGGTMCPSYMATRKERDSTRGRANLLRHSLANPGDSLNPFDDQEVLEVLDLCLSCKGCKNECPSNVDMARLKAEYLQQNYDLHGVPERTRRLANLVKNLGRASRFPSLANWLAGNSLMAPLLKKWLGIHANRTLPTLPKRTFEQWYRRHRLDREADGDRQEVLLYCDEFINYLDPDVGIATTELLEHFGYRVLWSPHPESGRASLSKGLVRNAKRVAEENIRFFQDKVGENRPLVGLEPSAILTFRDEYPDLVDKSLREAALEISRHTYLIDEFLAYLKQRDVMTAGHFSRTPAKVLVHGHCHQKALSSVAATYQILSLPENFEVQVLKTGCCGMAGSFGMETEHFELSMQIGELILFPALRDAEADVQVAAPGISCRHQIFDGVGRIAEHPVQILRRALAANTD